MNVEKTSIKLRRMVGALHRGFHYEGLSEDIFRAKLERANRLLKRLHPHEEMKEHRQRLAKLQRYMGYRRAEIESGTIPTIIMNKDGGHEAIRDGLSISKIGKEDIIILSNIVISAKHGFRNKFGNMVDLNHIATMLYGNSMPLEELARKLQVDIGPNRYEAIKTVGLKLIMDFDEIIKDAV